MQKLRSSGFYKEEKLKQVFVFIILAVLLRKIVSVVYGVAFIYSLKFY